MEGLRYLLMDGLWRGSFLAPVNHYVSGSTLVAPQPASGLLCWETHLPTYGYPWPALDLLTLDPTRSASTIRPHINILINSSTRDPPWPSSYDAPPPSVSAPERVSAESSQAGWPGRFINVRRFVRSVSGSSAIGKPIGSFREGRGISSRFRISISSRCALCFWKQHEKTHSTHLATEPRIGVKIQQNKEQTTLILSYYNIPWNVIILLISSRKKRWKTNLTIKWRVVASL